MTELVQIHDEYLEKTWPLIQPWIKKMVRSSQTSGRLTVYSVIKAVMEKKWQMWMVWKPKEDGEEHGKVQALVFTELYHDMSGIKICSIRGCVGEDRQDWVHLLEILEGFAKAEKCSIIETWARPGWGKILTEYKRTHILLEKRLDNEQRRTDTDRPDSKPNDRDDTERSVRTSQGSNQEAHSSA